MSNLLIMRKLQTEATLKYSFTYYQIEKLKVYFFSEIVGKQTLSDAAGLVIPGKMDICIPTLESGILLSGICQQCEKMCVQN